MLNDIKTADYELICIIVNYGMAGRVIEAAKHLGIKGATVLPGTGTANQHILEFLGLSDIRKECVLMVSGKDIAAHALNTLNNEFKFEKPNHGIAFTTPVRGVAGATSCKCVSKEDRGDDNIMYHIITVIVDRGKAEDVIDAAIKAGSKGGTIINGRGSGIHETSKLFSITVEPEKEIVLIISECSKTEAIVDSVRKDLKMEEPGNGIIFVQDVNKAYGLYE